MTQNQEDKNQETNYSFDESTTGNYYKKNPEDQSGKKEEKIDDAENVFEQAYSKDEGLLRQLDEICARSGVGYQKALEALNATGDVVEALIWLEEKEAKERLASRVLEGVGQIKERLDKRQSYRVQIRKNEKVIKEIPVPLAAATAGLLFIPGMALAGAIGSIAAMMNGVNLKLVRK